MPVALPALTRALKLQAKASRVGFDWNDPRAVLRKIREEADEIEAALDGDEATRAAEVGDLLFAAVNLARHLHADPEALLRQTNQKFERRFAAIEQRAGRARQSASKMQRSPKWMRSGTRQRRGSNSFARSLTLPGPRSVDQETETLASSSERWTRADSELGQTFANFDRTASAAGSARTVMAMRPDFLVDRLVG